ncbi:MAG: hypothetical protein ACE5FD_05120 [Anaerolineae bacterium]
MKKYIPLHQCPICRQLGENEFGSYAVMASRPSYPLPPETDNLEQFHPPGQPGIDTHHLRRCPVCGLFYRYVEHYEYDVNGSDDELYLTRLTLTETRPYLSAREFQQRLARFDAELTSPHANTKGYAAKCLMAHYLAQEDAARAIQIINSEDEATQTAVLRYLDAVTEAHWRLDNKALIQQVVDTAVPTKATHPLIKRILWRCGLK